MIVGVRNNFKLNIVPKLGISNAGKIRNGYKSAEPI